MSAAALLMLSAFCRGSSIKLVEFVAVLSLGVETTVLSYQWVLARLQFCFAGTAVLSHQSETTVLSLGVETTVVSYSE